MKNWIITYRDGDKSYEIKIYCKREDIISKLHKTLKKEVPIERIYEMRSER